jgi:hypothetical protein
MVISLHQLKGSVSGIYPLQLVVLKTIRSCFRSHADESSYCFTSNLIILISIITIKHTMKT